MTTKVTDQQVLAVIGDVPITNATIAVKLGIHRSNVAPHVKRLEESGLIKKVSGRWVRTKDNINTTGVPDDVVEQLEMIAFVAKQGKFSTTYEGELTAALENVRTGISGQHNETTTQCNQVTGAFNTVNDALMEIDRLSEMFPEHAVLHNLALLAENVVINYSDKKEVVLKTLDRLRCQIIGESEPVTTIFNQAQQEFCERLLNVDFAYDGWSIDNVENTNDDETATRLMINLMGIWTKSGWANLIGDLSIQKMFYDDEDELGMDVEYTEELIMELREDLGLEAPENNKTTTEPTLSDVSDLATAVFSLIKIKQRTEGEISRLYNFKKNEARGYIVELQEAGLIDEHVIRGNIYYTTKGKQVKLSGSK